MVRKPEEMQVKVNREMRGGRGDVTLRHLLNAPQELGGKGRLFARITLPPGASIGAHTHEGEFETFYVLAGQGSYSDNGKAKAFGPGDVLQTPEGGSHSVANTGAEDLELLALILYL